MQSDKDIASAELQKAWKQHQVDFGSGYQAQSFEAGWNAAMQCAARSYLSGQKLLELQGELE